MKRLSVNDDPFAYVRELERTHAQQIRELEEYAKSLGLTGGIEIQPVKRVKGIFYHYVYVNPGNKYLDRRILGRVQEDLLKLSKNILKDADQKIRKRVLEERSRKWGRVEEPLRELPDYRTKRKGNRMRKLSVKTSSLKQSSNLPKGRRANMLDSNDPKIKRALEMFRKHPPKIDHPHWGFQDSLHITIHWLKDIGLSEFQARELWSDLSFAGEARQFIFEDQPKEIQNELKLLAIWAYGTGSVDRKAIIGSIASGSLNAGDIFGIEYGFQIFSKFFPREYKQAYKDTQRVSQEAKKMGKKGWDQIEITEPMRDLFQSLRGIDYRWGEYTTGERKDFVSQALEVIARDVGHLTDLGGR